VLQSLARAGLVVAQKGVGYQLARPLQDITVLEVIEALTTHDEVEASKSDIGVLLEERVNSALANLTLAGIVR
jgi:DNA-binding IscR family transcriptional regulator